MMSLVSPKNLAETYSFYPNPWNVIQEYYDVLDYHARTEAGREKIATVFEIPEGRVRGWIDRENTTKPDSLRGIELAESNGWIPLTEDSESFPAINRFVGELYARGHISDNYIPILVVPEDDNPDRARELYQAVGLEVTEAHEETPHHSLEIRPRNGGSVFGRILACLGIPCSGEPPTRLPSYLDEANERTRAAFLNQLLTSRGIEWTWADQYAIPMPHRPTQFHKSVARLSKEFGPAEAREESVLLDSETHDKIRRAVA
jgi:hypothetical protein